MGEINEHFYFNCKDCGTRYRQYPHDEHSSRYPPCRELRKENHMDSVEETLKQILTQLKRG